MRRLNKPLPPWFLMFEVPCGRAEADAARCDELFEYRALAVITGSKKPRGRAGLARARIEGKRLGRPPIGSGGLATPGRPGIGSLPSGSALIHRPCSASAALSTTQASRWRSRYEREMRAYLVVYPRAKARGVRFGRPPSLTAHQRREALQRLAAGETQLDIDRSYNVDATTIGRLQA
jgi:hypothetical protein